VVAGAADAATTAEVAADLVDVVLGRKRTRMRRRGDDDKMRTEENEHGRPLRLSSPCSVAHDYHTYYHTYYLTYYLAYYLQLFRGRLTSEERHDKHCIWNKPSFSQRFLVVVVSLRRYP